MSITKTKEQIAELVSDGRIYTPPTDAELRALADSHTKLLDAAKRFVECKDVIDGAAMSTASAVRFKHLVTTIEEAEA